MTPTELDQLALEVACECGLGQTLPQQVRLREFARRYRTALLEKMEPECWSHQNDWEFSEQQTDLTPMPLYSLEGWK